MTDPDLAALAPRIRRYLTTMVGDDDVAAALTQETLRRGVERIDDLRDRGKLSSWLYSIAINLCRAHLKQQVDAPLQTDPPTGRSSVLSSIVRRESAEALALAIDRLPILLREAFVLRLVESMRYTEIAEITGATEATLQVRVHRAKRLLRRQLGSS